MIKKLNLWCDIKISTWPGCEILPIFPFYITLAGRGLEEHVRVSLIFAIIISFMLFTVFTLVYELYFEEFLIHDSRGFMILKNS